MSVGYILLLLVCAGVVAWLVRIAPFIDEPFKRFIYYALIVLVVLVIATGLGVFSALGSMHIGR